MGFTEQPPRGAAVTGLPLELTSFVGRKQEIREVRELLSATRVVTLVGPGGVGKTRLAVQAAAQARRLYKDGICFLDLAPLQDGDLLAYTVVEALGIDSQSSRDRVNLITDHLRERQMLLVFDNCEHVTPECARLINTMLRSGLHARVLATSRQSLGVTGEYIWSVPPLAVPDPDGAGNVGAVSDYPGLALFAERAARVAEFTLTEQNWLDAARLCKRLDGLPLAIELAAARTRVLSPGDILKRLDDQFRLLTSDDRAAPARHRTLRAAVDGSYDLCSPQERLLWARACVFARRFGLDAAENVCGDEDLPPEQVLDVLSGLVDKSVLVREEHAGGVKYRLLDAIAHYGRTKLREAGEEEELERRHRDWYLRLAQRFDAEWFGPDQVRQSRQMREEHDNLRAALAFCLNTPGEGQSGLVMLTALIHYWVSCGHVTEGRYWLERALPMNTERTIPRARALRSLGVLAGMQGDSSAAAPALLECRDIAQSLGDDILDANALAMVGQVALADRDAKAALAYLQEADKRLLELNHPRKRHIYILTLLGVARFALGEFDEAVAVAEELRDISARLGERWFLAKAQLTLGLAQFGQGDPAAAARNAHDALEIGREFDDTPTMGLAIMILMWAAMATGDYQRGAQLLGACRGIWQVSGVLTGNSQVFDPTTAPLEAKARDALGDRDFRAAVDRGAGLDLDRATEYALGNGEAAPVPIVAPKAAQADSPLTKREQQVAELVGQGMSNKEIAASLVVSPRTAEGHVERVLAKLGFTKRAQIAVWLTESRSD
ncbi:LuxR C-terminal-related transcriptional regulator [Kitasatospora sp. NBC_00240]|uniref:LuxR C-terminal-related transcriptional regulator n=1 Tax=Kitasatospora sp. NBC_00240 TaxID=2903567 RepID=UPI002256B9F1|nr:LuxR C-terminal-related transcriptional regulator [Kitasatospora sp. NBC_00240]MCX5208349.1 LuxR C-terminal-related transcriptional regulator [Kitasatospora sp. NBC_00240]